MRSIPLARRLQRAYARMAVGGKKETNLNRSLRNYQESLEISIEENEPEMICVIHSNLGSTNRQLGNVDAARDHYTQSLSLSQKYSIKRWTAVNLYGLGMALYDSGDLSAATRYLEEGLALAVRVQTIPDVLDNLAGLGCTLAKQAIEAGRSGKSGSGKSGSGKSGSAEGEVNSQEIAATILQFVQTHPRSKEIAIQDVAAILTQLQNDMPCSAFVEAATQAEKLTIPEAVAAVNALIA